MSTLRANVIDSAVSTEFKDTITANGDKQWVDSYGCLLYTSPSPRDRG